MTMRQDHRAAERGQASVELALLLPLVVVLLLAVLQVGLLARDVVLVTHAAREAARAAAIDPDPAAAETAASAAAGLDPARLTTTVSGRADAGSRVRVEVRYRSATDVPLVGALVGDRTLRAVVTMRVETAVEAASG
jgi:Flp pilus assembly protein TadG